MYMLEFKRLSKLHKYGAAISFLAMEIFAIIAFSFGDSFILYGSLSLALMVLLVIFNIKEISVNGFSSIVLFIFPLFLFTLVTVLGIYTKAHLLENDFNVAEIAFVPLGLLPIAFCGYMLSIDKTFNINTFLIVIYGALAAITIVNLIVNFVNFGAFYTIIYKGYRMYYGGNVSAVTVDEFAYVLQGLKFIEVKMSQYVINPALLLTSTASLLFISPKKNKKTFITYIGFALVAVLALVFIPSIIGLIAAGIVLVVDLLILLVKKYQKSYKPIKILIYLALFGLGVVLLLYVLAHQTNMGESIRGNATLARIFVNNRYAAVYANSVNDIFFDNFLGSYYVPSKTDQVTWISLTNSFLFDNVVTSGVIGGLAFVFMLFIGFKGFKKYILNSDDNMANKVALLGFTAFFTIFSSFLSEREFAVFYNLIRPIYMTGPFMIIVFIFCYVLSKGSLSTPSEPKEVTQNEEI